MVGALRYGQEIMSRRRRWLLLLGIPLGILSLVVVGGILAIRLTSPPAAESEPVAVRDIPDAWLAPAPEDTLEEPILLEPDELESEEERIAVPDFMPLSPFTSSGTLAFSGRGRDLGRETYELSVGPEGVELRSERPTAPCVLDEAGSRRQVAGSAPKAAT